MSNTLHRVKRKHETGHKFISKRVNIFKIGVTHMFQELIIIYFSV